MKVSDARYRPIHWLGHTITTMSCLLEEHGFRMLTVVYINRSTATGLDYSIVAFVAAC